MFKKKTTLVNCISNQMLQSVMSSAVERRPGGDRTVRSVSAGSRIFSRAVVPGPWRGEDRCCMEQSEYITSEPLGWAWRGEDRCCSESSEIIVSEP